MSEQTHAKAVLDFWFVELEPAQHFKKDPELDEAIKLRFASTYWHVLKGECSAWRKTAQGRLAEILVLDQFARNMFRGQAQAFAGDFLALALAQEMIQGGDYEALNEREQVFAAMPFMHSESLVVHQEAMKLFAALPKSNLDYEIKHRDIVKRFGRYPHRNTSLGRISTPEELDFMKKHSGF